MAGKGYFQVHHATITKPGRRLMHAVPIRFVKNKVMGGGRRSLVLQRHDLHPAQVPAQLSRPTDRDDFSYLSLGHSALQVGPARSSSGRTSESDRITPPKG